MAEKKAASERTYLGPAKSFRTAPNAKPIAAGAKVSLTDDQYRQLTRLGHSFDPPWTPPAAPSPTDVPDIEEVTV